MLAGMFYVTPLQSPLSLFSTSLSPDTQSIVPRSYPVFAPTSHPLPILAPVTPSKDWEKSQGAVSPLLARIALPSTFRLKTAGSKSRSTVFLVRENQCGLDHMRRGVVPGFANIWLNERASWGLRGVHPVLGVFTSPVYPYITPRSWEESLNILDSSTPCNADNPEDDRDQPIVILVKGPKRAGKSTFARASLNRLLKRHDTVAWLECDLGQAEFGCGGAVGLWLLDDPVLGTLFAPT